MQIFNINIGLVKNVMLKKWNIHNNKKIEIRKMYGNTVVSKKL